MNQSLAYMHLQQTHFIIKGYERLRELKASRGMINGYEEVIRGYEDMQSRRNVVDRLNPLLWLLSGLVLGVLICILLRPTPIASQNHYEHHGTAVHHHHGAVRHHVHHSYDSEMPELDGSDEPGVQHGGSDEPWP